MIRRLFLCTLVSAIFGVAVPAHAQPATEKVLLVVNASNDLKSLDATKLKSYYLGTLGFWENGRRVTVFQREESSGAAKRFFADVLRMAPSRYRHHWKTQQLSGAGVEPETVDGAASLVAKVAANAGGLGYILESEKAAAADNPKIRLIAIE